MKKIHLLSTILFSVLFATSANAQMLISIGAGGVYNSDAEKAGVNAHVILHPLPIFDFEAGYNNIFIDTDNGSYSTFDLDAHYVLIDIMLTRAYLIGGVNFATVKFDKTDFSETNTGINLGAGGEVGLGSVLRLFAELKYVTGNNAGVVGTAGLRIGF